ncbi:MAG: TonB-dependent receptor [Ferruginibacter sp.]|nr:TonB-dependent receptor [Bacteroidota bacterium]MBX2918949.1 TonB-dependent receptor [Ferruginibacter sp.]
MNKLLLLLTILFFMPFSMMAQDKTITGKVTDESGVAVAGVNVTVKGAKKATQTDKDGNFSITVSGKAELIFTSVGFAAKTVAVGNAAVVSVTLQKAVNTLDDVVVIGYQTVKRKDLLASVSSVGAKDLKDIPINSAAEALNGRLAGVTATTAEGSPDAQINIRVRGGMSITGDNTPLYIVDGIQVENGLSDISPQDIQSIDVLKDAAATAIYGARGGNGVIIITTKSGKAGRLKLNYNGYVGVKFLAKKLKVMSPYDFIYYQSERSRGSGTDSTSFTNNYGTTWDTLSVYKDVDVVDWQKEVFGNTGFMQTHNLSASGGSRKITYDFGYTYNDDKAVVLNSRYKRHLLNLKADYKITNNIKLAVGTRFTHTDVYGAGVSSDQGTSYNRLRNAVKYKPFLSPDQTIDDQDPYADPSAGNGLILVNPILLVNSEYRKKSSNVFNVYANVSWKILNNLTFKTTVGYNYSKRIDRQFSDSLAPYAVTQGGAEPIVRLDSVEAKTFTNSNVLTYSLKGIRKNHDIDIMLGEETYDLRTESQSSLYGHFPTFTSYKTAFKNLDMGTAFNGYPRLGKTRYTSLSFFGRINYSFKDKYLLSVNVREDGASKFGPGNKWGTFPSVSAAWRISKEKFMEHVTFINDLKLRAGFGKIGNNRIQDYLYLTTYSNNGNVYYGLNNNSINGYYPTSLVNSQLKWEATVNRNFGLDITMLNRRIDLSVDYYYNTSSDLLLNVPVASTYGYSSQLQNVGKTSNKGVDLQLSAVILRKPDNFTWSANFNMSFNKNKIEQLGINQQYFYPAASWGVSGQPTDYIEQIGYPVGSMYGLVNDGFYTLDDFDYNSTTGAYTLKAGVVNDAAIITVVQPGSIKFKDLNGDGFVDLNNDRKIIGNPTPKFTGGLNQQFTYKNWDMSLFVNFSYGNDIYNANKIELSNAYTNNANMLDIMAGRWKIVDANGQTTQWVSGSTAYGVSPDRIAALNANATIWQPIKSAGAFYPSSWAIEDGSFLRLNNITVGYSFPVSKLTRLHMSKLRLYVTANNLAVLTSYSGYDPEVSVRNSGLTPGLDYSAYPKSRSFIFGINASF